MATGFRGSLEPTLYDLGISYDQSYEIDPSDRVIWRVQ